MKKLNKRSARRLSAAFGREKKSKFCSTGNFMRSPASKRGSVTLTKEPVGIPESG